MWGSYLSEALDLSLANVPEIKGRWLVLVDASGSMNARYSDKSTMSYYEAATVFAAAFARTQRRRHSDLLQPVCPRVAEGPGESALTTVKRLAERSTGAAAGRTPSARCKRTFDPGKYDHVLLITDEQSTTAAGRRGTDRSHGGIRVT